MKLKDFAENPFEFMDNITFLRIRGHVFNPFRKYVLNRRLAFLFAFGLGLVPWVLFGFDSCVGQPLMMLHKLPDLWLGHITFDAWLGIWQEYYGKEMHYSAFLIYGLMYWFLSRHYDFKLGIKRSKNVAYAASITFLSIALFEFYWMFNYSRFQNQPWVLSLVFPQARIVIQNIGFITVGSIAAFYMWVDSFKLDKKTKAILGRFYSFRVDKVLAVLVCLSVGLALLWIYYPLPVEHINVTLENGEIWRNTNNFPQTLYTIDLTPGDGENCGVWFFLENNLVHGLNTLVKAIWTLTICYWGTLKKVETN
jgi:hypothetical protein